jgi:hypothetical protein
LIDWVSEPDADDDETVPALFMDYFVESDDEDEE